MEPGPVAMEVAANGPETEGFGQFFNISTEKALQLYLLDAEETVLRQMQLEHLKSSVEQQLQLTELREPGSLKKKKLMDTRLQWLMGHELKRRNLDLKMGMLTFHFRNSLWMFTSCIHDIIKRISGLGVVNFSRDVEWNVSRLVNWWKDGKSLSSIWSSWVQEIRSLRFRSVSVRERKHCKTCCTVAVHAH